MIGGINRMLAVVPGATALRTKRGLADDPRMMTEQRTRYGISHDLVDNAPDQRESAAV